MSTRLIQIVLSTPTSVEIENKVLDSSSSSIPGSGRQETVLTNKINGN